MSYYLTPPTVTYRIGTSDDPLWGKVSNPRGQAIVVYTDGSVKTVDIAPSTSDSSVDKVWPGGRIYTISDADAATLTDAGYGAYLTAVP